jgi:hypothetical protein
LIAQPGCGKTVALAHLAIQVINREPAAQVFHDYIPFLVHVADLDLPIKNLDDPLYSIIEFVAERAPVIDLPRTPAFVRTVFESGRALLLLDGLDELPPSAMREAAEFLHTTLKAFPKTRVVTTGCPEHIDGLVALGFTPWLLAAWDDAAQDRVGSLVEPMGDWSRWRPGRMPVCGLWIQSSSIPGWQPKTAD